MDVRVNQTDNSLADDTLNEPIENTSQLTVAQSLADALRHVLSQQGYPIDSVRLQDVILRQDKLKKGTDISGVSTLSGLINVLQGLGISENPDILKQPDAAFLPLLAFHTKYGWGVIGGQTPQREWEFRQEAQTIPVSSEGLSLVLRLRLKEDYVEQRNASFSKLLKTDLSRYKGVVIEAVLASFLINFLALAVSLFSMQVYDRVIPTRSDYTLIILASGVALIIIFEAFMKFARSRVMDKVVVGLDQYLSREVFQRLLKVRIDQMPGSVGSMAAQLRGYEQVRSFFTASTLFGLVDLPMTIIFITLIGYIGSPLVAVVPIIAASIAIVMGLTARKKIDAIAGEGASASYYKTGLLVETVEGVETIKAGSGGWKFLSRWLDVMNVTVKNDLDMKHANDNLSYFTQMLQQTSYVGIVIVGSFVVMSGDMTMGGLIACSILGGRVLAPVMAIPNLLVQYSHAKAAQKNIDSLFTLEQDNHGVNYPLSPTKIRGHYQCDNLVFNYLGNDRPAVTVKKLVINPGERIAILGPIGSGKSTLLKLLSGLYAPSTGRLLLDGLDIQQISREALSDQVGYLQQDHRLFQGTLRENLLIGMAAPSDDVIHDAMQKTGLINLVANHSSGLDLPISEGGRGLSGGQKQLVAFTRLLLTKPSVLLIDEPTASMDNRQEQRCLQVLRDELKQGQTLIVSTHKTALLDLVDRIIIMDNQQVVMDGSKADVLNQLMQNEQSKNNNPIDKISHHPKSETALKAPSNHPSGSNPSSTPNPSSPTPTIRPIQPSSTSNGRKDSAITSKSTISKTIVINPASESHVQSEGSQLASQPEAHPVDDNKSVLIATKEVDDKVQSNDSTQTQLSHEPDARLTSRMSSESAPEQAAPQSPQVDECLTQEQAEIIDNDVVNNVPSSTQTHTEDAVRIQPVSESGQAEQKNSDAGNSTQQSSVQFSNTVKNVVRKSTAFGKRNTVSIRPVSEAGQPEQKKSDTDDSTQQGSVQFSNTVKNVVRKSTVLGKRNTVSIRPVSEEEQPKAQVETKQSSGTKPVFKEK